MTTYEGIVEKGKIRLKVGVKLPEKARVYVIVPDEQAEKAFHLRTPRLKNTKQASDFILEISEESPDASI
ncbi:MAG: hypothetical protein NT121_23570 [Chloroflexi bacterium]|nr:hypothetical protein [Chloroflexota bacterium]